MAQEKGRNSSKKNQHSVYQSQGRYAKNKQRKLERHLKYYPNDSQAKEALNNIQSYRRKAPINKIWSKEKKKAAYQYRKAGLNGNIPIMKEET